MQPSSAARTRAGTQPSSSPGTRALHVDAGRDDDDGPAVDLVHDDRARGRRAAPAASRPRVSSPASDIAKQPPCAAASSSSGLVFPSGVRRSAARERQRAARRRRTLAAVSDPCAARTRCPSQRDDVADDSAASRRGTTPSPRPCAPRREPALGAQHLLQRPDRDLDLVERRLARRQPLQPEPRREQRHQRPGCRCACRRSGSARRRSRRSPAAAGSGS